MTNDRKGADDGIRTRKAPRRILMDLSAEVAAEVPIESPATPALPKIPLFREKDIQDLIDQKAGEFQDPSTIYQRPNRSDEESLWISELRQIRGDPRGPMRDQLLGSERMLSCLTELDFQAPNFSVVTALVKRAVTTSLITHNRLRVPNLLLAGSPGCGKSWYCWKLAQALQTDMAHLPLHMISDRGTLTGLNFSWRGARPGEISRTLLKASVLSPIFFVDEIEKSCELTRDRILDVFLTLLEENDAKHFRDDYLQFEMRADHAIYICTANDVSILPPAIQSRLLVVPIKNPSRAELRVIVTNKYQNAIAEMIPSMSATIEDEVMDHLVDIGTRHAKRVIDLAIPFAVSSGRMSLSVSDIQSALDLAGHDGKTRMKFGFIDTA
jgi:ATP-dependent Lon protease